jgi:hypothetical protein
MPRSPAPPLCKVLASRGAGASYVAFADTGKAEQLAGSVTGTVLPFSHDERLELITDPALAPRQVGHVEQDISPMGHRANRDVPVGHRANRRWSSWHGYADQISDI